MITAEHRVQALRQLGYTQREAEFLCLAALHSGYFLRRQYCRFIGLVSSRPDDNLVEKLLARGHAREISTTRRTLLSHLCSRSFYRTIGEEDNRHRRSRPQFAIRHKLMAFDYVLDNHGRYLANEEEKLDFFHRQCGIGMDSLPVKAYGSRGSESPALRYLVDKFLISILSDSPSSPPLISFSYVDEGEIATPAFPTFLTDYQRLMAALDRCQVVFITTKEPRLIDAEKTFRRFFTLACPDRWGITDAFIGRILTWLGLEDFYRAGRCDELEEGSLEDLRVLRKEFRGPHCERLIDIWKEGGEQAVRIKLSSSDLRAGLAPEFVPCFLPFDYDFLGASKPKTHQ